MNLHVNVLSGDLDMDFKPSAYLSEYFRRRGSRPRRSFRVGTTTPASSKRIPCINILIRLPDYQSLSALAAYIGPNPLQDYTESEVWLG